MTDKPAHRDIRCCYCRKRIYRQRNGAWYHAHNGSVACRPGEGSDHRATPSVIPARPSDQQDLLEPGKAIICPWHGPQLGIACPLCSHGNLLGLSPAEYAQAEADGLLDEPECPDCGAGPGKRCYPDCLRFYDPAEV